MRVQVPPSAPAIARRGLFGVGAALLAGTAAAQPMRQLTQAEAEYEPTPRDIRMCATCSLFVEPNLCKVVEGEVSPEGYCKLFALSD